MGKGIEVGQLRRMKHPDTARFQILLLVTQKWGASAYGVPTWGATVVSSDCSAWKPGYTRVDTEEGWRGITEALAEEP